MSPHDAHTKAHTPGAAPATATSVPEPDAASGDATQVQQSAPAHLLGPDALPAVPGYEVSREIARGGMGVVYAAFDPTFGREVAVKVMHPCQDAGRFVVEARVTARLPHPGVPPVHALGTLPDGRPFLAMKLIRGRTLAAELGDAGLPRLVGVLEQICQTVGFAHSQGVIHRDLKPANVMVGDFGEVQVMDWGLAKEVGHSEAGTRGEGDRASGVATASGGFETVAGDVKGTPAYMAPEQARGEPVDARADVFALGGILAAALTGAPPFRGETVLATVRKAAGAELGDCLARLDGCGADAELVAVARRCLAPAAADRYADGEAVAAAVAAYRAGVEQRLRRAERDRAVSEAEAREQRKRRKVQLALLAAVLLIVTGGGAFAWWQDRQAAGRRFKAEQARQGVHAGRALADDLRRQHRFAAADAALAQAEELARGDAPELLDGVAQARADLAFVVQLDDVRFRKWVFVSEPGGKGDLNTGIASPAYRKAFAARGLDLAALPPADAAARVADSGVKAELVAAVDDWALYEPDEGLRGRLLEVARRADPGAWTDRLRDPAVRADKAAVARLAADADPARTSSAALSVLAELMRRHGLDPAPLLSAARARHPTDFGLAFALGRWHTFNSRDGREVGPYEAARALRPDNLAVWNNLGAALRDRGNPDEAIAAYREAIRIDPRDAMVHNNLGAALYGKDDFNGAIDAFKEAIRLDPSYATAHSNLGVALKAEGDPDGAVVAYREAIKHDPKYAPAYYNLGNALRDKKDPDGAVAAYREAIKHNPTYAVAHYNLGLVLRDRGDPDGAIAAFREATKHDPKDADAHFQLGVALYGKKELDGAIAAFAEATRLDPKDAIAHFNLGLALQGKGQLDRAIASYREAVRLDPGHADAFTNLGVALYKKNDVDGSVCALTEAVRIDPENTRRRQLLDIALKARAERDAKRAPPSREMKRP